MDTLSRLKVLLHVAAVSEFLDVLDEHFPEATPRPGADLRDIDVAVGRREVVRQLLRIRAEGAENILEND